MPKTLSGSFVHKKFRGLSVRCFHGPNQRALVLDSLSIVEDDKLVRSLLSSQHTHKALVAS